MNSQEISDYLRGHYSDTPTKDLAVLLGLSVGAVYSRASDLGLRKSSEFTSKQMRWAALCQASQATRFKKGQIPHNKGKKQHEFMSAAAIARSVATRFRKGNIPHNHRPVGSERINIDGYMEVKTAEPNTWISKHCNIYREHHGDIPAGHMVIFKDGNHMNCAIDSLMLISRQDNMRRNSLYNYPEDIKAAMKNIATLNSTLTKKIKKHEKQFNT
jgi:hypothetical protein